MFIWNHFNVWESNSEITNETDIQIKKGIFITINLEVNVSFITVNS